MDTSKSHKDEKMKKQAFQPKFLNLRNKDKKVVDENVSLSARGQRKESLHVAENESSKPSQFAHNAIMEEKAKVCGHLKFHLSLFFLFRVIIDV